jgi:hypothetical protein
MQAYEIFHRLSENLQCGILEDLLQQQPQVYRGAAQVLSTRRNLRPVFLERKPRRERSLWIAQSLGRKANNDLATEALQFWLLDCRLPMVSHFLDRLEIAHDGKGVIADTPSEPADLVASAVDSLLQAFPAEEVAVYLNLFVEMDPESWPVLRGLLSSRPELQLSLS